MTKLSMRNRMLIVFTPIEILLVITMYHFSMLVPTSQTPGTITLDFLPLLNLLGVIFSAIPIIWAIADWISFRS